MKASLGYSNMTYVQPNTAESRDSQTPYSPTASYNMDPVDIYGQSPNKPKKKRSVWPWLLLVAGAVISWQYQG